MQSVKDIKEVSLNSINIKRVEMTGIKMLLATMAVLVFFVTVACAQKIYTMDKNHARVGFSVVHFGISHVEGNFKIIDAVLQTKNKNFADATITFTAAVNSINTDVEYRDNDLKSTNYFDAVKFPSINFTSTSFKKIAGNIYRLVGNITIHGITKPVIFNVTYNGEAITAMKKPTAGFTITGKIRRMDFGVGGTPATTGIGNNIELRGNVEFTISE